MNRSGPGHDHFSWHWAAAPWLSVVALVVAVVAESTTIKDGAIFVAVGAATFSIGRLLESRRRESDSRLGVQLTWELERARRGEHPLAIVRLGGSPSPHTVAAVKSSLRLIDAAFSEGGAIYVVMPEQRREGALAWIERLELPIDERHVPISVVEFPEDGVTLGSLLEALAHGHRVGHHQSPRQEPDPRDTRRTESGDDPAGSDIGTR